MYHFYPRSPCGERPPGRAPLSRVIAISIHALLAESDNGNLGRHRGDNDFYPRSPCGERLAVADLSKRDVRFLSTLSLRRATCGNAGIGTPISISIHALLAESDYFHYL